MKGGFPGMKGGFPGMKGGKGKGGYPVWKGSWTPPEPVQRTDPLSVAIRQAVEAVKDFETVWDLPEMEKRVGQYILKATSKFTKDERLSQQLGVIAAQALVEEFVNTTMGAVSCGCYEKEWYAHIDLGGAIYLAAKDTFKGTKLFSRVLAPKLREGVDDCIFRFREEERIQRVMEESIALSGIPQNYQKKLVSHLSKSYEEAQNVSNGTINAPAEEVHMLQEFVKGWMTDFQRRAYASIGSSVGEASEQQIIYLTALFQILCGPKMCCLPFELTQPLASQIPEEWPFIAEVAEGIFLAYEQQAAAAAAKGKGKHGSGQPQLMFS